MAGLGAVSQIWSILSRFINPRTRRPDPARTRATLLVVAISVSTRAAAGARSNTNRGQIGRIRLAKVFLNFSTLGATTIAQ
jgi:hypothetical protein